MSEENIPLEEIDVDFIFDDPKVGESISTDESSAEPSPETTEDVTVISDGDDFDENGIPQMRGMDCPDQFKRLVERVQIQYAMLPNIEYDEICRELADLSIKATPTPTLQVLNDEIEKVQSAKDRLAEIFIDVYQAYNFKKRTVDVLKDSWGKFTQEKNAESRKGDSAFRLSNFIMDLASLEALVKACTHVLKNLDSLHDSLSRRITVYQLTMKLRDLGRTALPDYDFRQKIDESSIIPQEEDSKVDKNGELEVKNF